jgi:hypothetical protein
MAYFSQFPKGLYDLKKDGNSKVVVDLMRRVKIKSSIIDEVSLYDLYDVIDGDTPESLAFKIYGDSELHYIILLTNNILDRYYDWPLNTVEFENFLNEKYINPDGIHHYEISQSSGDTSGFSPDDYSYKIEVNSTTANAVSVTNREYEERLQDKKRQIKILNPSYIGLFIDEFKKLIVRD